MEGGQILASTERSNTGNAGSLEVRGGRLALTGGAQISTSTRGGGRGGDVSVMASEVLSITGADSGLFSSAFSSGNAGELFVSTPLLTMDDGLIQAVAATGSQGNAGDIDVRVGRLMLTGGAQIRASTNGAGPAGVVTVTATDAVTIAGRDRPDDPRGISIAAGGTGTGGHMAISAPVLELRNGAQRAVLNDDERSGGSLRIEAGRLTLRDGGQVRGSSIGGGRGADLIILASEEINMPATTNGLGNGFFSTAGAGGDGGSILIKAPILNMGTASAILTGSVRNPNSNANAGDITIEVHRLTMTTTTSGQPGALIDTTVESNGRGGKLTITASDAITISGSDSLIFSAAFDRGKGGEIFLTAPRIALTDGAVGAFADGQGIAGDIFIQAGETFRSQNGTVTTAAEQAGGGRIELRAGHLVQLQDSEVTTSVRGGGGDAGNLTLTSPFVVADGSAMVANAFGGVGGEYSHRCWGVSARPGESRQCVVGPGDPGDGEYPGAGDLAEWDSGPFVSGLCACRDAVARPVCGAAE
jgi:large exoprotein involved in heme utilization and adhesion